MTDSAVITPQQNEHFWRRVRSALGVLKPVRDRTRAYGQAEIERTNPLRQEPGELIEEVLAEAWTKAGTAKLSLSLMIVEIDRVGEYFTAYGHEATEDCLMLVMQAVREALPQGGDICVRLGRASFAVILPDQALPVARKSAQAISNAIRAKGLVHKESHAGIVTASIGLVVTQPEGYYAKGFFETANGALKRAQRRGMCRIEALDMAPVAQPAQPKAA